mmetsp:Transcript_44343/g.49466  ORF Transcript_44343/g.49466 Transcript_44343/m.49466 type:complete len:514 (-) Transcript_44343:8-1549(-)
MELVGLQAVKQPRRLQLRLLQLQLLLPLLLLHVLLQVLSVAGYYQQHSPITTASSIVPSLFSITNNNHIQVVQVQGLVHLSNTCTSMTGRRRSREKSTTTTTTTIFNSNNKNNDMNRQSSTMILREQTQQSLYQKSILLTGASGGLGKALALQIASSRSRPKLLVLSGRNGQTLHELAKECRDRFSASAGADASATSQLQPQTQTIVHVIIADLSKKESVQQLGESALEFCKKSQTTTNKGAGTGTTDTTTSTQTRTSTASSSSSSNIDILINCGGVSSRSDFLETQLEIDERVMQINFFSGASLAKILVPGMMMATTTATNTNTNTSGGGGDHQEANSGSNSAGGSSGTIIWISSVQGLMGIPSRTSYAASKFAVQGYCEALRAELDCHNIRVHCVSPGYIKTNLSVSAVRGDGSAHGTMDETTAKGADPHDVAVEILNTVFVKGANDFVVASTLSAKVAIWLRFLFPSLLQKILVKRYEKATATAKKENEQEQQEGSGIDNVVASDNKKID